MNDSCMDCEDTYETDHFEGLKEEREPNYYYSLNVNSQTQSELDEINSKSSYEAKRATVPFSTYVSPNSNRPKIEKLPFSRNILKEGWLMKRGEHIKNLRRRYFVLREDGTFHGYRNKPKEELTQPLNNFTVRDCEILCLNKPKPFSFLIRGLQLTNVVERLFVVDTEDERQAWIFAIKKVASELKPAPVSITVNKTFLADNVNLATPAQPRKRYGFNDFQLLSVIGKGTFGKVVLCREMETGMFYAMKILKRAVLIEKHDIEHTMTEGRVQQQSRHPFMTQLKYKFKTQEHLCFVMEYVNGGDLYYYFSTHRTFNENIARFYGSEILLAIGYLHEENVIYRDLKLENLLLDHEGHVKLADFGLCKEEMYYGARTSTVCGTPEYLAPEVLLESEYNRAVDWWGFGVVMHEMMTGKLPFYSRDWSILYDMIVNDNIRLPAYLSTDAKDLLTRLLVKNPEIRLGGGIQDAIEIMEHRFFSCVDWDTVLKKQVPPPWKPDVRDECDIKYIPEEFAKEPVTLTPPDHSHESLGAGCYDVNMDSNMTIGGAKRVHLDSSSSADTTQILDGPYFRRFSYHGSKQSLGSLLSSASSSAPIPMSEPPNLDASNNSLSGGGNSCLEQCPPILSRLA